MGIHQMIQPFITMSRSSKPVPPITQIVIEDWSWDGSGPIPYQIQSLEDWSWLGYDSSGLGFYSLVNTETWG